MAKPDAEPSRSCLRRKRCRTALNPRRVALRRGGAWDMELCLHEARLDCWAGRSRRRAGAPRRPGRRRGRPGAGGPQAAPRALAGRAYAGRCGGGRGCRPGDLPAGVAQRRTLAARRGAVRHLAAPRDAQSLLRPASPPPRASDGRTAGCARSRACARPWSAGGGRWGEGRAGAAGAAGAPARSHRAVPLPGARQHRGGQLDGCQRRGAGEPALARPPRPEVGSGRSRWAGLSGT